MKRPDYVQYLTRSRQLACGAPGHSGHRPLAVAVFASRERPAELVKTLLSVVCATDRPALIDVLVNGNADLAAAMSHSEQLAHGFKAGACSIRVWNLPLANKAHAWNTYVHAIAPDASLYLFLDGYVEVEADSVVRIDALRTAHPAALAFSGSPGVGRSSTELQTFYGEQGGLHGNLFALTSHCIGEIRRVGALLPLGLYGFDTVLGGMLGFGLQPKTQTWDIRRFVVSDPQLRWRVPAKSPLNWRDVRTQLKRLQNNALRQLVRRATTHHLERQHRPLAELEITIDAYIHHWKEEARGDFWSTVMRSPLSLMESLRMRHRYSSVLAVLSPELLAYVDAAGRQGEGQ